MERALSLALSGWGGALPNPMVGAVLVKGGKVIGEGAHLKDGGEHAEIRCLRSVGSFLKCSESEAREAARGSTLYVTLEPCSTKGRTGACTEAIISSGIKEVVVAAPDPNPKHSGRGVEILREAGIVCECGVLREKSEKMNFVFNYSITHRKALVALKCAMSSDGKIAERRGVRTRITGDEARENLMKWREHFPSIGVGAATVVADNPSLSARFSDGREIFRTRLVLDSHLTLADFHKAKNIRSFNLFSDSRETVVVCASDAEERREEALSNMGVKVMRLSADRRSEADFWEELKSRLYCEMGIAGLMVEGGAGVYKSLMEAGAADYAFIYKSRIRLGKGALPAFERRLEIPNPDEFLTFANGDTLSRGKIV